MNLKSSLIFAVNLTAWLFAFTEFDDRKDDNYRLLAVFVETFVWCQHFVCAQTCPGFCLVCKHTAGRAAVNCWHVVDWMGIVLTATHIFTTRVLLSTISVLGEPLVVHLAMFVWMCPKIGS